MIELMKTSPYDAGEMPLAEVPLVQLARRPGLRWHPSRFNARMIGEDGRLILWNTFSCTISVFQPHDVQRVLDRLAVGGVDGPLDKTAEYLFQRGYLVRGDVDEMALFRVRYAREQNRTDLLQFHILASEDCNFRCTYCYEKFKRGTMRPGVRRGIMNLVLQRASRLTSLAVSYFGGEPLYGWDAVRELAPFFKSVADQYGIRLSQNMTTNGYLLTKEKADLLFTNDCRSFQITLDGLPEQHDCKRVGRDGSPTYAVIMANLRALAARPEQFKVMVRVNFDRQNSPMLERFLDELSKYFGGDERFQLFFRAVGKWGGDNDANLDTCGIGEERPVLRRLQEKAAAVGMHQEGGVHEQSYFGSQVCYAARPYNFIVGASGKLMKCTIALDTMPANIVGQLHEDGTMELDDGHMAQWTTPHFETDSLCQSCHVLPTCQGAACPITRLRSNTRTCCQMKSNLKHELKVTLLRGPHRPAPTARPA